MKKDSDVAILIVDDKPRNLFALEQILKDVPARIIQATSGDEALALSLKHEFALAILDVQMPGMDGYELAELLLGNPSTSTVPIIFVSAAYQDESHRFQGYASGAVDYLVKPLDPAILLGKVRVFLELGRVRTQLENLLRERTRELDAKAELLTRRDGFRDLLRGVSRDLQHHTELDPRRTVEASLAKVGEYIGASHAFVQLSAVDGWGRPLLAWWSVEPEGAREEASSCTPHLFSLEALRLGTAVVVTSLEKLEDDRKQLTKLGVSSLLLFPIIEDAELRGVLGFDWRGAGPGAQSDQLEFLAPLSDTLHSALMRSVAETRRLASEAQHRNLFDTTAQGVIYQTPEGTMLSANAAASSILGCRPGEIIGEGGCFSDYLQPIREDGSVYPPREHPAVVALRSGRGVRGALVGIHNHRDQTRRWILVDAVPLFRLGERNPYQVYTTFSDLTALKAANEEKERLTHVEAESKAKSEFLASISHEIRTPMNAVLGYTQLLLREAGLSARQREYLETIDRSGVHLLALINNVLDMARIESGANTIEVAPTDLEDVITDTERMFRHRAAEKRLAFRVERPPEMPGEVLIDAGKVRQVLINLLGNAMKFTHAGSITLRLSTAVVGACDLRIILEVEDTGFGIPAEQLAEVFKPFVQVAPGAARVGTGLGLSVSRRFARAMGGEISATSTLGVGSTFRFEFVAEVANGALRRSEAPRAIGLADDSPRMVVLLVEDDPDNRTMLTRTLAAVGLAVIEACNVEEAVSAFAKEPCGLVLSDMHLPDGDGLEVMHRIRALPGGATVPVVIVSASALKHDQDDVVSAGVDGFVGKPVREAELFAEISRLTGIVFRYAGDHLAARPSDSLRPAALHQVPKEQRAALVNAVQGGYLDEVGEAIRAFEQVVSPDLAQAVRKLADDFKYGALIKLLEHGQGEP